MHNSDHGKQKGPQKSGQELKIAKLAKENYLQTNSGVKHVNCIECSHLETVATLV